MKLAAATALLAASLARAEPPLLASGPLRLELPAVDLPFNAARGTPAPSMAQALAVSRATSTGLAWAVDLAFERRLRDAPNRWGWELGALIAAAVLTEPLPFFGAWNHEEFHRATLGWRGIHSHDGVYDLDVLSSTIPVDRVADADLVRFKREHPGEFARMSAAGMEGDIELARAVAADDFLDRRDFRLDLPSLALLRAGVVAYMFACDGRSGDRITDRANARESDPRRRDFTGLDCVGWAYDVQRPDEPYEARGTHPSGVGIDRYRKTTDLTSRERRLLTTAKWLSLANLVDLSLLGVSMRVPRAPESWRFTFGLAHQMTSFGHAVTLDLYVRAGEEKLRAAIRQYLSDHRILPGVEASWVRRAATLGGVRLELSPGAAVWLQPARGRWDARASTPGALVRLRVAWLLSERASLFAEVQGKSAGWVAGTVLLGPGIEGRLGVAARL